VFFVSCPGDWFKLIRETILRFNLLVVGDGACLPAVLGRYGGDTLLTTSMDVTAKLLSAESGECLRAVEGHRNSVMSAALAAAGRGEERVDYETILISLNQICNQLDQILNQL